MTPILAGFAMAAALLFAAAMRSESRAILLMLALTAILIALSDSARSDTYLSLHGEYGRT